MDKWNEMVKGLQRRHSSCWHMTTVPRKWWRWECRCALHCLCVVSERTGTLATTVDGDLGRRDCDGVQEAEVKPKQNKSCDDQGRGRSEQCARDYCRHAGKGWHHAEQHANCMHRNSTIKETKWEISVSIFLHLNCLHVVLDISLGVISKLQEHTNIFTNNEHLGVWGVGIWHTR